MAKTTTTKPKVKDKAAPVVPAGPATRDECAAEIAELGELQRRLSYQAGRMNERMSAVTAEYQPTLDGLKAAIDAKTAGVQRWCEAHRDELLADGKRSAKLVTGEVGWRARRPSVIVTSMEAVIAAIKQLRLGKRLLRVEETLNKTAVLDAPELVRDIDGISVQTGLEDFYVKPFENPAASPAA